MRMDVMRRQNAAETDVFGIHLVTTAGDLRPRVVVDVATYSTRCDDASVVRPFDQAIGIHIDRRRSRRRTPK